METSGQLSGDVTTFDGRGIHPIFIEYIDEQLVSGTTPKRTYNLLLTKYEDQEHRRLFPSVQQIRSRAMTLSRKNDTIGTRSGSFTYSDVKATVINK